MDTDSELDVIGLETFSDERNEDMTTAVPSSSSIHGMKEDNSDPSLADDSSLNASDSFYHDHNYGLHPTKADVAARFNPRPSSLLTSPPLMGSQISYGALSANARLGDRTRDSSLSLSGGGDDSLLDGVEAETKGGGAQPEFPVIPGLSTYFAGGPLIPTAGLSHGEGERGAPRSRETSPAVPDRRVNSAYLMGKPNASSQLQRDYMGKVGLANQSPKAGGILSKGGSGYATAASKFGTTSNAKQSKTVSIKQSKRGRKPKSDEGSSFAETIARMYEKKLSAPLLAPKRKGAESSSDSGESDAEEEEKKDDTWEGEPYVTRCACGFTHNDDFMIECDKCGVWQHGICMKIKKKEVPDVYLCEQCNPTMKVDIERAKRIQERRRRTLELEAESDNDLPASASHNASKSAAAKPKAPPPAPQPGEKKRRGRPPKNLQQQQQQQQSPTSGIIGDSFKEIETNQYSKDLMACVVAARSTFASLSLLEHLRVKLCDVLYVEAGRAGLVATRTIPPDQPVIEYRGLFLLASQCKEPDFTDKISPYVLFYHNLDGVEVVVDARTMGSLARFVRRSCQPNAEVKHVIDRTQHTLHLLIVAIELIERGTEISIPFDYDFSQHPVECACSQPECPVREHSRTIAGQASKSGGNKRVSTGTNLSKKPKNEVVVAEKPTMKREKQKSPSRSGSIQPEMDSSPPSVVQQELSSLPMFERIGMNVPTLPSSASSSTSESQRFDESFREAMSNSDPISSPNSGQSAETAWMANAMRIDAEKARKSHELSSLQDYWVKREQSGLAGEDWTLPGERRKLSRDQQKMQKLMDQFAKMDKSGRMVVKNEPNDSTPTSDAEQPFSSPSGSDIAKKGVQHKAGKNHKSTVLKTADKKERVKATPAARGKWKVKLGGLGAKHAAGSKSLGKGKKSAVGNDSSPASRGKRKRSANDIGFDIDSDSGTSAKSSGLEKKFKAETSSMKSPAHAMADEGGHAKKRWLRQVMSETSGGSLGSSVDGDILAAASTMTQWSDLTQPMRLHSPVTMYHAVTTMPVSPLKKRLLSNAEGEQQAEPDSTTHDDSVVTVSARTASMRSGSPSHTSTQAGYAGSNYVVGLPTAFGETLSALYRAAAADAEALEINADRSTPATATSERPAEQVSPESTSVVHSSRMTLNDEFMSSSVEFGATEAVSPVEAQQLTKKKMSLSEYRQRTKRDPAEVGTSQDATVSEPSTPSSASATKPVQSFMPSMSLSKDDTRNVRLPALPEAVLAAAQSKSKASDAARGPSFDELKQRILFGGKSRTSDHASASTPDDSIAYGTRSGDASPLLPSNATYPQRPSSAAGQTTSDAGAMPSRMSLSDRLRAEFGLETDTDSDEQHSHEQRLMAPVRPPFVSDVTLQSGARFPTGGVVGRIGPPIRAAGNQAVYAMNAQFQQQMGQMLQMMGQFMGQITTTGPNAEWSRSAAVAQPQMRPPVVPTVERMPASEGPDYERMWRAYGGDSGHTPPDFSRH